MISSHFETAVGSLSYKRNSHLIFAFTGLIVSFLFSAFQCCFSLSAQVNVTIDPTFQVGSGFKINSGTINISSVVPQPDGKILVGGSFNSYNGTTANCLIRLKSDGSVDSSFKTGSGFSDASDSVSCITLQSVGKILVGGYFSNYKGSPVNNIIRLNSNGSIDTTFNKGGSGFNDYVSNIVLQKDGKILVAGVFTTYNGKPANQMIRLYSDGRIDPSFSTDLGFGDSADNLYIDTVALQSNGEILIGGEFTDYNQSLANNIIRLKSNGKIESTFNKGGAGFIQNLNSQSPYFVNSIVLQNDGKILVGGLFSVYHDTLASNIVRLNNDGSVDSSFNSGYGFNNYVSNINLQSDGRILAIGLFSNYQNYNLVAHIIRLNSDGSADSGFNTGVGFDVPPSTSALQSDGKLLVAGIFTTFNDNKVPNIIRLNIQSPTPQPNPTPAPTPLSNVSISVKAKAYNVLKAGAKAVFVFKAQGLTSDQSLTINIQVKNAIVAPTQLVIRGDTNKAKLKVVPKLGAKKIKLIVYPGEGYSIVGPNVVKVKVLP